MAPGNWEQKPGSDSGTVRGEAQSSGLPAGDDGIPQEERRVPAVCLWVPSSVTCQGTDSLHLPSDLHTSSMASSHHTQHRSKCESHFKFDSCLRKFTVWLLGHPHSHSGMYEAPWEPNWTHPQESQKCPTLSIWCSSLFYTRHCESTRRVNPKTWVFPVPDVGLPTPSCWPSSAAQTSKRG